MTPNGNRLGRVRKATVRHCQLFTEMVPWHLHRQVHIRLVAREYITDGACAKALRLSVFGDIISHFGEEFTYRIKSTLDVHLNGRAPITITKGGGIYFDSGLGHACVSTSEADATVLGVCWKPGEQRSGGSSI